MAQGNTYVFRNLGVKDRKVFINANMAVFGSYNLEAPKDLMERVMALLLPSVQMLSFRLLVQGISDLSQACIA